MISDKDLLNAIHTKAAERLHEWLEADEVTPQQMAQIIKFLQNNHVDVDPDKSKPIKDLLEGLQDFDAEGNVICN